MNNIKVFDFFSGCGGTSKGLSLAGFDIVFGMDVDKDSSETFKLNFPNSIYINEDIRTVKENVIEEYINELRKDENFILFSGCAPCQPFSKQNKNKGSNDPRVDLLGEFSRFVRYYVPDLILIENVPGLQKFNINDGPFSEFIECINKQGYKYTYGVIPALWFGVPQTRERLVLLASKHFTPSLPEKITDGVITPFSTVRDWIAGYPKIQAGEQHEELPDHVSAKLSALNIERIKATPEGKGRESWPAHLILECHKKYKGHTDVYGRLSWDKPASGLTTKCISYSNGRFGHPEQDRALSVREAASLQTFPIDYKFSGSLLSKARQIGNAVPPKMAEALGNHLSASLKNTLNVN